MNSKTTTFSIDILAIIIFAILARLAHQTAAQPFTLMNVLNTLWPFLLGVGVGWVFIAARATAANQHGRDLRLGAIVWLCAAIFGLGIWAIRNGAVPHWSFIIVATTMSAILLLGWRLIADAVLKN